MKMQAAADTEVLKFSFFICVYLCSSVANFLPAILSPATLDSLGHLW